MKIRPLATELFHADRWRRSFSQFY